MKPVGSLAIAWLIMLNSRSRSLAGDFRWPASMSRQTVASLWNAWISVDRQPLLVWSRSGLAIQSETCVSSWARTGARSKAGNERSALLITTSCFSERNMPSTSTGRSPKWTTYLPVAALRSSGVAVLEWLRTPMGSARSPSTGTHGPAPTSTHCAPAGAAAPLGAAEADGADEAGPADEGAEEGASDWVPGPGCCATIVGGAAASGSPHGPGSAELDPRMG